MKIKSIFGESERIPSKYTCDGENINPPLEFIDVPKNAKSLALIVDDPDSPSKIWCHWVVWGISANTRKIPENSVPDDAVEGINDFEHVKYDGPCPHSGTHKYRFILYALDIDFKPPKELTKTNLENAIKTHVIDKAILTGKYSKPRG
jgi:Raf kinase inhibitor-like YbhB/YbcL family protein